MAAFGLLAKGFTGTVRYLRGVLGEDSYDRYLAEHARRHPGHAPLTAREYWKERMDWQDRNPQGRCC